MGSSLALASLHYFAFLWLSQALLPTTALEDLFLEFLQSYGVVLQSQQLTHRQSFKCRLAAWLWVFSKESVVQYPQVLSVTISRSDTEQLH